MNRSSGFYWVLRDDDEDWIIAEYYESSESWFLAGKKRAYCDLNFEKIDERTLFYDHKMDQ